MAISSDFRTKVAEATVEGYRIVKAGTAVGTCVKAAAATDKLLGTSDGDDAGIISFAAGDAVDVAVGPVGKVRLGGTVAVGDILTSNADGKAIATTTAGNRYIGLAEVAGVADDVITYLRSPGLI